MRHAIVAILLAALPVAAFADTVASKEEEAALRAGIASNPPTAATLSAQPYPGSKLDMTCSASQSAPRQPQTMVYCFYSKDPPDKVRAYVQGPGKPAGSVPVFVNQGEVVDEHGTVLISDVTRVTYYVSAAPVATKPPEVAAAPTPATTSSQPGDNPTPADPASTATGSAPQQQPQDDGTEAAKKAAKKLKGLLGL